MDKKIKKFTNILKDAIQCIGEDYYKLKVTYNESGIVRERVFCYELYHQIRKIQDDNVQGAFVLNGELDKRGHREFDPEDRANPDFVLHIPGDMEGNTAVIEVKGESRCKYKTKITKDFETLITFIQKYDYKVGYFILFNYDEDNDPILKRAIDAAIEIKEAENTTLDKIRIILAKKAGVKPVDISLLEYMQLNIN